jgi:anaerobic selenocysteine-containing dehydrogenase/GMP synthase-like glutamine amidotransferase
MTRTDVTTTCTRDCPNTCGLAARVENGQLVRLAGDPAHPLTRGLACAKAQRYIRRAYSPERVTTPLIKKSGRFEPASWDQALDLIAERLTSIIDQSGPEAILYYQGYGERTALKLLNRRFFSHLGGVTTLRGSLCGGAGMAAQNLDLGERVSHDPLDHLNSRAVVLWARNPVSTNISLVPIIRQVRDAGGRVVLIDPIQSRSTALADRWIAPRPGCDAFLALAAAKRVLAAGAEDRSFIDECSEHFQAYQAILDRFDVPELCARAGVDPDDASYLAETYVQFAPTATLLGWGLHRHEHAHHTIRAVDALAALSGNIGVSGGGVSQGFEEYGPYDQRVWGDDLHPPRRTLLMPRVGEEILSARDPEIRAAFVTASNPVCMAPNTARVAEAFSQLEFVVYSGHFLDDTAEMAHVFLPATTFLEEDDVMATYGHNYVGPVNQVIAPVGKSKSEFEMFQELARRFPFADEYVRPREDWLAEICAPIAAQGADLAALRAGAFRLDAPMVPYADRVFPTSSGKFRFMNEFEPAELERPDPEYPFHLLTIAPHDAICSERTAAEHTALPVVRLNATEAAARDVTDGDLAAVVSPLGRVKVRVRTDPEQRRDVLAAERGGWLKAGHGLNRLTRDMASAVGEGTPYYETRVNVTPWPSQEQLSARVLIVQNGADSPAGVLAKELLVNGAWLETVQPFRDGADVLPSSPEGFDGLVVLGGPQNAFDDESSPYFPKLVGLMRDFDAAGKPVLGVCLGCQLLARAHGGKPQPGLERLEFGYHSLETLPAADKDPVLGPALPLPRVMEFHQDTFEYPEGAEPLVQGGEACPRQAFRVGQASWGFQFHFEVDSAGLEGWFAKCRRGDVTPFNQCADEFDEAWFAELYSELPLLLRDAEAFCRRLARSWLALTPRPVRD